MLARLFLISWLGPFVPAHQAPTSAAVQAPAAAPLTVDITGEADITVVGGNRADVRAREGSRELDVRTHERRVEIVVPSGVDAATIEVPKDAQIQLKSRSGDVEIAGVAGRVLVETIAGDVKVSGRPSEIEVESVAGDVDVEHAAGRLRVRSVSGDVVARVVDGALDIKVTSGDVSVGRAQGRAVRISTMSGDIRYVGAFVGTAAHELRAHQGDVDLVLDTSKPLVLHAITQSGELDVSLGTTHVASNNQIELALGEGGPKLQVQTYSGDIRIRRGGRG